MLLSPETEYISAEPGIDICLKAIGSCKFDIIKVLWSYILCDEVDRIDLHTANITIITVVAAIIISIAIARHPSFTDIPIALQRIPGCSDILKWTAIIKCEKTIPERKATGASIETDTIYINQAPGAFNTIFVSF